MTLSGSSYVMRILPVIVLFQLQFLPLEAQTTDIAAAILPVLPESGVNRLTYQHHIQRNNGTPTVISDTTVIVAYTFHDASVSGDSTIYPIFKLVTGPSGERDSSFFNIIVHHMPEQSVTYTEDSLWQFGYPFLQYFPCTFIPGEGNEIYLGNGFPGSVPDSLFGTALPDSLAFRVEYGNPGGVSGFWSYRFICKPADGFIHEITGESNAGHQWSEQTQLTLVSSVSAVSQHELIPETVRLLAPYPNPVRNTATIEYSIARQSEVRLSVQNILGQEIALLESGTRDAGRYQYHLDTSVLPAGLYIWSLVTDGQRQTRKMLVMQ